MHWSVRWLDIEQIITMALSLVGMAGAAIASLIGLAIYMVAQQVSNLPGEVMPMIMAWITLSLAFELVSVWLFALFWRRR